MLTIGEVSDRFGIAQHILRYWEKRFPQLRPLKRSGNRRYYRPDDVALVERIDRLLNRDGYTVKGVQKLLAGKGDEGAAPDAAPAPDPAPALTPAMRSELRQLRDELAAALAD